MKTIKQILFWWYNRPYLEFLLLVTAIGSLYIFRKLKSLLLITIIVYIVLGPWLVSSLISKLIDTIIDAIEEYKTNAQMKKWKDSTDNSTLFYMYGWKNDYLHDLLAFMDKRGVLPGKNTYLALCSENNNGKVNCVELYKILVNKLRFLSDSELLILKSYIQVKDKRSIYQNRVIKEAITIFSSGTLLTVIYTIQNNSTIYSSEIIFVVYYSIHIFTYYII